MPTVRPMIAAGDSLVEQVHAYADREDLPTEAAWAHLVKQGLEHESKND